MPRSMPERSSRPPEVDPPGLLSRAGIALGLVTQPALWAAGRWGLRGEAGGALRALDREGLAWLAARRTPTLDAIFGALTHLGSFAVTGPLALALAGALALKGDAGGRRSSSRGSEARRCSPRSARSWWAGCGPSRPAP